MTGYDNNAAGTWTCTCGRTNTGKFCVICGSPRPVAPPPPVSATPSEWMCSCGRTNTGKFCVACGTPRPAGGTVSMPPGSGKPATEGVGAVAAARAAQEAAARKAAEEAAARQAAEARAAQEAAARKAAEEAAARKAAEARKTAEETASPGETDDNTGMMKKAAIGVAVLLLLIGAYFMFGRKKETPPAPEATKVETKAETKPELKTEAKTDAEKPMDPAVREAKLKEYALTLEAANKKKKEEAIANEKIVFLAEEAQRRDNDLVIAGHFFNGKKNRTIIGVKGMELDIVLRDMDKEIMNEKNVKYDKAFSDLRIEPLTDSRALTVRLPGKAPAAGFNNFAITAHDVHWEAVAK